jgi:hypothetical protein
MSHVLLYSPDAISPLARATVNGRRDRPPNFELDDTQVAGRGELIPAQRYRARTAARLKIQLQRSVCKGSTRTLTEQMFFSKTERLRILTGAAVQMAASPAGSGLLAYRRVDRPPHVGRTPDGMTTKLLN